MARVKRVLRCLPRHQEVNTWMNALAISVPQGLMGRRVCFAKLENTSRKQDLTTAHHALRTLTPPPEATYQQHARAMLAFKAAATMFA